MRCPVCAGAAEPGWLCEEHPGKPWQHDGCGAAGMPCVCNPAGAVLWGELYAGDDAPGDEPLQ